MSNTVREDIYKTLNDLLEKQFKDFKWWLKGIDYNEKPNILTASLEKANQQEVVDLLIQHYGEDAPKVCICVLQKSNINDVAKKLEETLQKDYRSYVKTQFKTIEDPNSPPGERVSLDERYSTLIILDGQRSQQERVYEIQAIGREHTEIINQRAESSARIETLFDPKYETIPQTVVLQGAAGIGKTTMAKKIMLDWASQKFYHDRFNYVFYISCRELNRHAESEKSSIAEIISKQLPTCDAVENFIQNILKNERKLLFIIDGFDELRYSFDQAEDSCCSDPWKKEPIKIILRSLFQKKLLPKSSLIITTRPIALKKLNQCLQYPRFLQILGFSREKREEYFQKFFEDKDQAVQAFRFVKQNDILFTMCVIPLVSWIICTVMKQEMEGGKDLQKMPCTHTAIYILYLSGLLKYHHQESEQDVQRKLKNVCSLAAEGIWNQQILFTEEEVMMHSLVQDDFFPLFLNENNFKRDIHCIKNFSFVHLSFQEFFASLFYVLEGGEQHHSENLNRNLPALLNRHKEYFRSEFAVGFRFLFGFLNEENRMRELKQEFGWEISCENKELLLNWVKNNINSKINAIDLNWITQDNHMLYLYNSFHIKIHFYLEKEILSYLYETQDENFVRDALCAITEINYQCNSDMELMILTYCIQHCQNLEYLYVRSPTSIYQADNGLFLPKNNSATRVHSHQDNLEMDWKPFKLDEGYMEDFFKSLTKLRNLRVLSSATRVHSHQDNLEMDWKPFKLDEGYMEDFFKSLTKLRNLRVLRLENLHVTVSCKMQLVEVFRTNQKLKELNFIFEDTNHSAVELLCKVPCEIETLELNGKGMTRDCSMDLADVFWGNQKLKELKLYLYNMDDKTANMLFWGLLHRNCKVEKLWLSKELTESCSWRVAELVRKSQTLKQLWLVLGCPNDQRFKMICEALQDRHCKVEELWFFGKCLTDSCSWHLARVLMNSQILKKLWLWVEDLPAGRVNILCRGLQHPKCKLEKLCIHEGFLSKSSSSDFIEVLKRLKELQLFLCRLDEKVKEMLCKGLQHPDCQIKKLRLEGQFLTESFCRSFAEILRKKTRLRELDLLTNNTNNIAVEMLCEGLKHADCNVIKLGLGGEFLTKFFSSHLSDVFRKCQRLKELELFPINNIVGVVDVLCEGLNHSDCKLEVLRINGEYLKVLCGHSLSFGKQIAKLVNINQNLQEFYLHGDCISDYETKLLCEELKHSRHNLKELWLNEKCIIQNGEWMDMEHTT